MKINFITSISDSENSGGISGMNAEAYTALAEMAEVRYIGPIYPPVSRIAGFLSKVQRGVGLAGEFYFYNRLRLLEIAGQVARQSDATADCDFYMGFTPWILCKSPRPYVAWNDCSFVDYLKIYHNPRSFSEAQRNWLHRSESAWMARAERIFLSSQWALDRTKRDYELPNERVDSLGIFGSMAIPEADEWDGSTDFYFISTDFRRKNGNLCREAMDQVWKVRPQARLRIIGSPPPAGHLVPGRVTYEGFYNKRNDAELAVFRQHLAKAFALIHPTDADINPLTIIEAGYFGCPAISVDDFALREVTCPSNHRLLLPRPLTPTSLMVAMVGLLDNEEAYRKSRLDARAFAIANLSPAIFRERFKSKIVKALFRG